ncbi:MAG: radical SAM family heme chaperone HemW [Clostridia bacterium]|nr:radical SAM family heme chaperone HemW [Clostridia bacterium]
MNNIALYFHIPFCVKKCDYCAFYSLGGANDTVKEDYFNALLSQLSFFSTEKTVSSVYFGGGTPPMLGIERLCKLLSTVQGRFKLADDCEITVEVNPKTVDFNGLKQLRDQGFNRLSVGVQSADDGILKSVGRIHSFADAVECIENAHKVGFDNVSADIIFALPSQTKEMLSDSLSKIMSTNVVHISAYSLQLEEGTPLYDRRDSLALPTEEIEEAQYELLCKELSAGGFMHYEISSFCKDGKRSRHNLAYWKRTEYFGFGASAHSFYNNRRFSNVADVNEYIRLSELGLFAPTDYEDSPEITPEEALEEAIMLGLRTSDGAEIPEGAKKTAASIASLGYGDFENGILSLNSKGFRVSNSVISEIINNI